MVQGVLCDKDKIIEAIERSGGIITRAAQMLGINPKTIYNHMKFDSDVAKAVEDARQIMFLEANDESLMLVEKAYGAMHHLLEKNDVTATIFVLKSKGNWVQAEPAGVEHRVTIVDATEKHRPELTYTT